MSLLPDHEAAEILSLIRKTPMIPLALPEILEVAEEDIRTRAAIGAPPDLFYNMVAATLLAYWNEITFDGKPATDDTTKVRFGAFRSDKTGYICAIVMDILEGDLLNPRRIEKGIIALKLDSTPESRLAGLPSIPMIEVFLHRFGDGSTNDADMRRVISLSVQEIVFWSPVRFAVSSPLPPPPQHPPTDPIPPRPPAGEFVYHLIVKGIPYSFRMGSWEDIKAVFRFPVDDDVVASYNSSPSESRWREVVDRMFVRRDD